MSNTGRNFIYNLFQTVSGIIFPIITFSYTSRILGPEGIGKFTFVDVLTRYFILFAAVGIPIYGIREVARIKGDRDKLKVLFSELFSINLVLTVLALISYYAILSTLDRFYRDTNLFHIGGMMILVSTFNSAWYFKGVENFKLITILNTSLRAVSIFLVFMLVNESDHYTIYFLIYVSFTGVTYILSWLFVYRDLGYIPTLNFKIHQKPILLLFASQLVISVYVMLDSIMLGLLANDKDLGLYTASIKVPKILVTIITSLGVVLLPKIAQYFLNNNYHELSKVIQKTLYFIILVGFPMFFGLLITSNEILYFFAGSEFIEASLSMNLLAPLTLLIGLSNLFVIQILVPSGNETLMLKIVAVGAVTNLVLNLILIPRMSYIGAALSTLIAEFLVTFLSYLAVRKWITLGIERRFMVVISGMMLFFLCVGYLVDQSGLDLLHSMILKFVLCCLSFAIFVLLNNDPIILNIKKQAIKFFIK